MHKVRGEAWLVSASWYSSLIVFENTFWTQKNCAPGGPHLVKILAGLSLCTCMHVTELFGYNHPSRYITCYIRPDA